MYIRYNFMTLVTSWKSTKVISFRVLNVCIPTPQHASPNQNHTKTDKNTLEAARARQITFFLLQVLEILY